LYGHQSPRSDIYGAYWVPKQGAAAAYSLASLLIHSIHPSHLSSNDIQRGKTIKQQVPVEPLVASLAHPLMSRLGHAVDILVFNPPYVPTSDEEVDAAQCDAGIAGSWAGGTDGMQVTDALLRQVDVGVFCISVL
jgi:hypothetical protein